MEGHKVAHGRLFEEAASKKIDLAPPILGDVVVPGITHAMIEKELAKFGPKARKSEKKTVKRKMGTS